MAAVLDDEEVARKMLADTDGGPRRAMDMQGWTYERELLTAILESVQRLTAITIAANSKDGKAPRVPPLPRPETAVQRIRLRVVRDQLDQVVTAFRPRE